MRFSVEPRAGYLYAQVVGRESADDMRLLLRATRDACRKHGCARVLISVRASRAVFRAEEYGLAPDRRGYASGLATPACRVAVVGDTAELNAAHEYIELVARQHGLDVRAFREEAGAVRWLVGTPEPTRRYPFGRIALEGAPDAPGVYALWEHEELVYYGRAASLRARLLEHYAAGERVTHYSWETCADPAAREAELLGAYRRAFGRLPRGNRGP